MRNMYADVCQQIGEQNTQNGFNCLISECVWLFVCV